MMQRRTASRADPWRTAFAAILLGAAALSAAAPSLSAGVPPSAPPFEEKDGAPGGGPETGTGTSDRVKLSDPPDDDG